MKYRFDSLLVVTYGRSGSTLLSGLLNSIPGVLIRGENENIFEGLWIAHQRLVAAKKKGGGDETHPWFGIQDVSEEVFLKNCAALAKDVLLGGAPPETVSVYGFKEIRYVDMAAEDLRAYLDFLRSIFPACGIVFNARQHDAVLKSAWWRTRDPDRVRALLERFDEVTAGYSLQHPDVCLRVTYDGIVNPDGAEIRRLFDFLEAPYQPDAIAEVLARRHSFPTE